MPEMSKETASQVLVYGPVIDRREEMDGYTVEFVSFAADSNLDGPLQSLRGGACKCPHWRYVIAGRMRYVFQNHEEVYEEGAMRSISRPGIGPMPDQLCVGSRHYLHINRSGAGVSTAALKRAGVEPACRSR